MWRAADTSILALLQICWIIIPNASVSSEFNLLPNSLVSFKQNDTHSYFARVIGENSTTTKNGDHEKVYS